MVVLIASPDDFLALGLESMGFNASCRSLPTELCEKALLAQEFIKKCHEKM
jgi:hypothetical protein